MKRKCFQQKTLRRICTINVQGSLQNTASGHDATVNNRSRKERESPIQLSIALEK